MTATELWTFTDAAVAGGDVDLSGWAVEAVDGEIGTIDEATYDAGASFIVVDTGTWIFGRTVLLPAGVVERLDPESERVFLAKTKEEVKNAPEYDPERPEDELRGEHDRYWSSQAGERFTV